MKAFESTKSQQNYFVFIFAMAATFLVARFLGHPGFTWPPYVTFMVSSVVALTLNAKNFFLHLDAETPRWIQKISFCLTLVFLAACVVWRGQVFWLAKNTSIASPWFFIASLGVATVYFATFARTPRPLFEKVFIALVFANCFLSILELPNWQWLSGQPMAAVNFIALALLILFPVWAYKKPQTFRLLSAKPLTLLLCFSPVLFFLSFRTDAFFIDGSAYHWEYYVGPIRTVLSGGSLLWDTPSQYGFLNIFLMSKMGSDPWWSFYVFQSALLLTASPITFLIVVRATKDIFVRFISLFGLPICFFFADPVLIGPQLFPSSSVLRFFCAYLFIFYIWLSRPKLDALSLLETVSLATLCFVGGAWSAESLLYTGVSMGVWCLASLFYSDQWKKSFFAILKIFFLWIGFNLVFLLGYQLYIGHIVDLRLFVDHAFGYAAGFCALEMFYPGVSGFLMIFALLVLSKSTLTTVSRENRILLTSVFGVTWALTSYYVGRSAPNNVTAILPLLFLLTFCFMILVPHSMTAKIPFFFVVGISVSSFAINHRLNYLLENLGIKFVSPVNILAVAEPELAPLIQKIDFRDKPFVSYSLSAFPPRELALVQPKTFLPAPFQLLEMPVDPKHREQIIERFVSTKKMSGIFIQHRGDAEDRVAEWLELLGKYFDIKVLDESSKFKIYEMKVK